jgi:hypothetical protein
MVWHSIGKFPNIRRHFDPSLPPLLLLPTYIMLRLKSVLPLAFLALVTISQGASIVFTAGLTRNGFDEVGGDDLDAGNLVRTGFFDIPDATIIANKNNLAFLASHFREFDNGIIGSGVANTDGHISATLTNTNPADVSFLTGKQIYLWALFSTDTSSEAQALATIQQHAILYFPNSLDADWTFPDDLTGGRSPSLRDLTVGGLGDTLSPDAKVLVGSFGPGTSDVSGKPNFTTEIVPEPSTATAVLASVGLLALRRRRRA